MKHKFLIVLMAIAATLCMAFGFSACGGKNPDETGNNPPVTDPSGNQGEQDTQKPDEGEQETPAPHVHSYGEWEVTKEATCKEEGTKERSCACGEKETETLPLVGHDFEDMTCKVCGTKASLGLEYTLINEDKEYEISGIGSCKDKNLIITNNYEGKPVTSIGKYAFWTCSGLTSVTIPNSVTSIGDSAFSNCDGLTLIVIPDSVTSIGEWAFGGTAYYNDGNNWTDDVLYIGNHLIEAKKTISGNYSVRGDTKTIADEAFYLCWDLISVTIPNSVTSIGRIAFRDCSGLTSVTIPDSVTSIGEQAFSDCGGLTSVTIGSSVTSIGAGAFVACNELAEINVDENNQTYHAQGNCLIETQSKTLILGCKTSKIPDDGSVTSIGDCAFMFCDGLTSITIPDSVTSIGLQAFCGCDGLTSITIPDSVTSIGAEAFAWCDGLTSITIPDSVTEIGRSAFKYCDNLEEVHFKNPYRWKAGGTSLSGLDNPATAAEYLTDTYSYYPWHREG